MIAPSNTSGSVEKSEPTIQLTEAQRSQLQEALLGAGQPYAKREVPRKTKEGAKAGLRSLLDAHRHCLATGGDF